MSKMYERETAVPFASTQQLHAVPPAALRRLIDNLFAHTLGENDMPVTFIEASEIPGDVLNHLNAFASWVAQRPTNLVVIRRCSSCYINNEAGNLATTEDGMEQCWKC
jgi:hypothetical protein